MSSTVVGTVAWLALLGVAGVVVAAVVLLRRLAALSREHTERKWELVVLRAEIGDLRRRLRAAGVDPTDASDPPGPSPPGPEPDDGAVRARPSSPTAWRRERTRAPARPRRRRPG